MPAAGNIIEFNNHERKFKTPYIIYGDFECLTTKTGCDSKPVPHCDIDNKKPFTTKYQKHVPTGYKLSTIHNKQNIVKTELYRGVDCMEQCF